MIVRSVQFLTAYLIWVLAWDARVSDGGVYEVKAAVVSATVVGSD